MHRAKEPFGPLLKLQNIVPLANFILCALQFFYESFCFGGISR